MMKTISPETTTIGFVGTGVMGCPMALHLQEAGYQLFVHNRTASRARPLVDGGATFCETPGAVAAQSDVIFAIVGFPPDVESVFLGEAGILQAAKEGAIIVDMTTSRPDLAVKIAKEAAVKGVTALDAPVSGGDVGAKNGALSIMVGGEQAAFEALLPLFELMGGNIVYQGPAGSGQHTKMSNQIAIASTMLAMCESLTYAKAAGLDPETVLASISKGAAGSWTLTNLAPRVLKSDYAPGFYVKHFIKDMQIALDSSEAMGIPTPGLKIALEKFVQIAADGYGDNGTQAVIKAYE
ncbi:MAG: NAD(P)-dependent oxidoreductase [Verrucomicrobiota bacterium]